MKVSASATRALPWRAARDTGACRAGSARSTGAGRRSGRGGRDPCWPGSWKTKARQWLLQRLDPCVPRARRASRRPARAGTKARSSSSTPKLLMAEPKKIPGSAFRPGRRARIEFPRSAPAPPAPPRSGRAAGAPSPSKCARPPGDCRPSMTRLPTDAPALRPPRRRRCGLRAGDRCRPGHGPMPIGQVIGVGCIFSTASISSSSSIGRAGRHGPAC